MYVYISGKLKFKNQTKAIVDNSGIGYEISISSLTYNNLPEISSAVLLHTYHHVREDREELYGFLTREEKKLFEVLIAVSNIGPSKAIVILSQISPSQFVTAIRSEDIVTIASIKGIGRKTAERMIMELKDKILELSYEIDSESVDNRFVDALSGLKALGFKDLAARDMLNSIKSEIVQNDKAEDIIRKALKKNG